MTDDTERDLLPWILGGSLVLVAAIAAAAIVNSGANPTTARLNNPPSTRPIAHPTLVVVNDPSTLPTGEVWECQMNGQRVFSDAPCAGRSTIRELSPINRMQRQAIATDYTPADYSGAVEVPILSQPASYDSAQVESYCTDLRTEVTEIYERMRQGYPSPVGDYLRGRLRAISDQQVRLHCVR